MKQVVFAFGMVAVVVVDADSKFLYLFEEMYKPIGFKCWRLSRGNHKGNSVENTTDF